MALRGTGGLAGQTHALCVNSQFELGPLVARYVYILEKFQPTANAISCSNFDIALGACRRPIL